jgi:hypothetical protein
MATYAETQTVIARACRWVEEHPRRAKAVRTDLDLILLMANLNVGQASAASPIGQFMVRAALRLPHNEDRAPLVLLAGFRAGMDDSDPVHTGLKDLKRVTEGDAGGRVLHRLTYQAGRAGCHLYQLGKLLHCLTENDGDERPDGATSFVYGLLSQAYQHRWTTNRAAS